MDIEKELQRIAEQYRAEGYAVVTHPDNDHLDSLPADFGADILAVRGPETVVVQVKHSRADVEADAKIPLRAETINRRPGWRYDLIVLDKETPVQRIADKSQEPTNEQFLDMINRAERAKEAGLNEMALTHAWAALEAAMRRLRYDAKLYDRTSPSELVRTMYGNGFLSRPEFDLARTTWSIRTQVVHGFVPPEINASAIDGVLALAKKVMGAEDKRVTSMTG
jgi:hypothetical protein